MTNVEKLQQLLRELSLGPMEIAVYMGWSMPTYYSRINGESEWKASEIVKFTTLSGISKSSRDAIFLGD